MSYKVDLRAEQDYIRAEVSGARILGDAATDAGRVGEQVVQACNEAGIRRVLLILNLSGRLSAIDSYEMVTNAPQYGWKHAFRLAMVDLNEESFDDVRFTETVAVNRSYEMKVFNNEQDALDWLLRPLG